MTDRDEIELPPFVNMRTLDLSVGGNAVLAPFGKPPIGWTRVTLCWTDDGRAWIESEKNRELAASLRREWGSSVAADALDGGVR